MAGISHAQVSTGHECHHYETLEKMLVQTVPCQAAALDQRNGCATILALRQMRYENALRPTTVVG